MFATECKEVFLSLHGEVTMLLFGSQLCDTVWPPELVIKGGPPIPLMLYLQSQFSNPHTS
jgi:hypothetical protein